MDCTFQSPKSSFCKKSLSMPKTLHITAILFLAGNQGDWLGQQQVSCGQGTKSGLPSVWVGPYCWSIYLYIYIFFYIFDGWKKSKIRIILQICESYMKLNFQCLQRKFYWNKTTPINFCFCIICSCFCDKPTLAECNSCHRHHVGREAKIFTIRPFIEKSLWTPEKNDYLRISLRLEV